MQEKAAGDLTAVWSLHRSLTIQTLFKGHSKSNNRRKWRCWQNLFGVSCRLYICDKGMALVERWI